MRAQPSNHDLINLARRERTAALFRNIRSAVDALEEITLLTIALDEMPTSISAEKPVSEVPLPRDKLTYTIQEVVALVGISKSTLYLALGSGGLPAIKMGGRTLIAADELRRWLGSMPPRTGAKLKRRVHR